MSDELKGKKQDWFEEMLEDKYKRLFHVELDLAFWEKKYKEELEDGTEQRARSELKSAKAANNIELIEQADEKVERIKEARRFYGKLLDARDTLKQQIQFYSNYDLGILL